MTRHEALAEVQKRWGPNAWVYKDTERAIVGVRGYHGEEYERGSGDSFESAFADADQRNPVPTRS